MLNSSTLEERLRRMREQQARPGNNTGNQTGNRPGNRKDSGNDILARRQPGAQPVRDVIRRRPEAETRTPMQSTETGRARKMLNQTRAPERSVLGVPESKARDTDRLFEAISKKYPDRDKNVLDAGIRKYRENVQKGLPAASKPVTVDDIERLGNRYIEENQDGYLETMGKGVVRGFEGLASGVGSATRWAGDVANIDTLSKAGEVASDYWEEAAQEGWAAPGEYTFSGTFLENPSLKRASGIVAEALPSLLAALVAGGAGAGAAARAGIPRAAQLLSTGARGISAEGVGAATAATGLGVLEGAPQYEKARESGKGEMAASGIGLASTMGTALLEFIPISRILKRAGAGAAGKEAAEKAIKRIAKGGAEEGMQEASQTLWQNTIAKIGYDKTQKLTEGIVEAIIGGAGAGGIAGAAFNRGTVEALEKKRKRVIDEAKKAGATDEEIQAIEDDLARQTAGAAPRAERDWADRVVRQMSDDELIETIGTTNQSFQSSDPATANRAGRLMQQLMGEAENRGMSDKALEAAGQAAPAEDPTVARRKLNQEAIDRMDPADTEAGMAEPAGASQSAPEAEPVREPAAAREPARHEKRVENLQSLRNNAIARKQKARGKAAKKKIQKEIDGIDAKITMARQEANRQAARQQQAEAQVRAGEGIENEYDRFPDGLEKDIADQEEADRQIIAAEGQAPGVTKNERKVIFNAETALKAMRRKMRGKPNNDPGWQQVNELKEHIGDARKRDPYAIYHLHELYGKNVPRPDIARSVDFEATPGYQPAESRRPAPAAEARPAAQQEAETGEGRAFSDSGYELSAGEPMPGTVAVMKSGRAYTKKGIDKLVRDRRKAGENVEAVDLGNDQWGWRRIDEFDADLSDLPDESQAEGPGEIRGFRPAENRVQKEIGRAHV